LEAVHFVQQSRHFSSLCPTDSVTSACSSALGQYTSRPSGISNLSITRFGPLQRHINVNRLAFRLEGGGLPAVAEADL
jgi:hypothetical protein